MGDPEIDKLRELAAATGDPWTPDHAYFALAEHGIESIRDYFIRPLIDLGCDFTNTLDLAAGHGRNSVILVDMATQLAIMDIQPGNIEICRKRFSEHKNVSFYVNNGFNLEPISDASLSLIYCFDAAVHFDSDVIRSYLRDALRVLKPGGRAFFHHSNYTGGQDWFQNPHARNFMSRELFGHYAYKEGLKVIDQRLLTWGDHKDLDCLSLVERPA